MKKASLKNFKEKRKRHRYKSYVANKRLETTLWNNLDKMGKSLEKHKLLKLTYKKTKNLDSSISSKETKFIL